MNRAALDQSVSAWVAEHPLIPVHVDCATAVMMKILDGKCKMTPEDKIVMAALYRAVKDQPGVKLGADMHAFIAEVGEQPDEELKMEIYEQRVLAETMISRPVMKAFKALIREQGLFERTAAYIA